MEKDRQLLEELLREEDELQFDAFTNDDALRLGLAMVERARAGAMPLTVDVRRNGQQLFHCALAGTSADNDEWILRKARVVDRYGHSSLYVGAKYRARGTTFDAWSRLDLDRYAAHGGAFPIIVRDVGPVGTVAVSGLQIGRAHV